MAEEWGNHLVLYLYDADGIRTSKNIDGTVYEYILNGSQIIGLKSDDRLILYIYDETGAPVGIRYRTSAYKVCEE